MNILVTCEHAINKIPPRFSEFEITYKHLLNTHFAWDSGALIAANILSQKTGAKLFTGKTSRLFIDLNRSINSKNLFGKIGKTLVEEDRNFLINNYYNPFRKKVLEALLQNLKFSQALHLSIHSFSPSLNGTERDCDIGILYDPSRRSEKRIAHFIKNGINRNLPDLKVRMNYPYKGISDGHTSYLRTKFIESKYYGLEIEFNQKNIKEFSKWANTISKLIKSI